ncbi:MAG: UvrD-helicase domain-containing protein, partial [Bacteroidia bacterium]
MYEFADMIDWVVKAWAEADDLLLDYKEQFQFVLVDEYQDTSGMQNQLLFSLIEDTDLNPNCFVVGDDDQSIYAFQGAEVSNMQHFAKTYREAGTLTTVMLTENYRSSQSILDASRGLIEHNQQRLVNQNPGLSKILSAAGKNKAFAQHAPTVERFTHEFHEACGIAHRIQELKEQGVPLKEIAVLYAQHKHANALLDLLPTLGIDAVQTRSMDALQEPLVQHLLRWLEYLALESEMANAGDHLLYRLLLSPLYQVDPYELNQLSMFLAEQNRHSSGPGQSWRDALAEIAKNKPESAFAQLQRNIEEWIKLCTMGTVP